MLSSYRSANCFASAICSSVQPPIHLLTLQILRWQRQRRPLQDGGRAEADSEARPASRRPHRQRGRGEPLRVKVQEDRSGRDIFKLATEPGARFNTVPKTGPNIVPKSVPNSLFKFLFFEFYNSDF